MTRERDTLRDVKAALERARRRPKGDQLGHEEAVALALEIIHRAEMSTYLRKRTGITGSGDRA